MKIKNLLGLHGGVRLNPEQIKELENIRVSSYMERARELNKLIGYKLAEERIK